MAYSSNNLICKQIVRSLFEFLSNDRVSSFNKNVIILIYYFVLKGGKLAFVFFQHLPLHRKIRLHVSFPPKYQGILGPIVNFQYGAKGVVQL